MRRSFRIYKEYQVEPEPKLSDSATNTLEFYFKDFPKSIPYVWAQYDFFFTTYRQMKTTRIIARKFLTNLVENI